MTIQKQLNKKKRQMESLKKKDGKEVVTMMMRKRKKRRRRNGNRNSLGIGQNIQAAARVTLKRTALTGQMMRRMTM